MESWASERGNLSPAAASARLRYAVVALAAAIVLGAVMAKLEAHWGFRLALFFPFFLASDGFLQGLFRT